MSADNQPQPRPRVSPMPSTEPADPAAAKPALPELFRQEEAPLLRYAFSLTGRRAIAEEIVQDVFLQLHRHWDEVANPVSWLYRSIRNRAYNHHRDHKREVITDETKPPASEEKDSPEELLQRMEAAGYLRLLLADLEEADRQLVHLKYFEDLKYREISEQTGLSIGNVGYRLHHVLKQLAERLRQFGIDGTTP